jgi:ATP-binding cassette subfamily C protein CydD
LFNRAIAQTQAVRDKSNAYREKTMNVLKVAFLSSAVLELFSTVSIAMIAVYLGLGLLGLIHVGFAHQLISLQNAFFILLLAPECFAPLRSLGAFYHAKSEAVAAANELLKIVDGETQASIQPTEFAFQTIDIECVHLQFKYIDQKPLFSGLNARIPANKITLIVGPSGSGKTTLLKMLCQFQTAQSGHITVNQFNLRDIGHENWIQHISYLPQRPYLFHDTILNNITLHEDYPEYAIYDAAHRAGVLDFAAQFPEGLHTLIGEQYLGLSGGQAQRVALARAILKDAPLILLDEPTAHLDHHTKQFITHAVLQWKNKKTIVIATHDTAFLSIADHGIDLTTSSQEITDEHSLVLC